MSVSLFASSELLVAFLDDRGLLSSANDAQCEQLLLLAGSLDIDSSNAALHREFRAVEEGLRGLVGVGLDELSELMNAFGSGNASG